jgi:sugar fermentation stimulation protein A
LHGNGTYALILHLGSEHTLAVGKLAILSFPPGYYLYVGSALRGLFQRVKRHVNGGNKLHWHIDYLRQVADVVEVWYLVSDERLECKWFHAAKEMEAARVLVSGFGASDCGCKSHLVYFAAAPSFEEFERRLGDEGLSLQRITGVPELLSQTSV